MQITLKGELTDLNAYIKALNNNRFTGNNIKQTETKRVEIEARNQKLKKIEKYPIHITYKWYSKDKRKDIDNIAFAKKFINDGLVNAGIIENDSRKFITGFSDEFYIDRENPRIEIKIKEL